MYCVPYDFETGLGSRIRIPKAGSGLRIRTPYSDDITDIRYIFNSSYKWNWNTYIFNGIKLVIMRKNLKLTRYILGKQYSLFDIKTIKNFKINITPCYIADLCVDGNIYILAYLLEMWLKSGKKSNLELKYDEWALNLASENGHVNVLDWWLKSGKEFDLVLKYSELALDFASQNGYVNVLEWWLKSGLELKYSTYALNWASSHGHINVLDWWLQSGLELKYTRYALNWASERGHVNVLEWWLKSGLELKYNIYILDEVSAIGHVNVLEWWLVASKESGLELKYTEWALNKASINGHINVLDWWLKSSKKYSQKASKKTSIFFRKTCIKSSIKLKYTTNVILMSVRDIDVQKWWLKSGLDLKYHI